MNGTQHATDERNKDEHDVHEANDRAGQVSIKIEQHESGDEKEERVNEYPLAAQQVEEGVAEEL